MRRNLDEVYFRVKTENICFSDLTPSQQEKIVVEWEKPFLIRLCKCLAASLKSIGDQFNIVRGDRNDN